MLPVLQIWGDPAGDLLVAVRHYMDENSLRFMDGLRGIGGQAGGHESSVRLPAQRNPAQPGDILKTG